MVPYRTYQYHLSCIVHFGSARKGRFRLVTVLIAFSENNRYIFCRLESHFSFIPIDQGRYHEIVPSHKKEVPTVFSVIRTSHQSASSADPCWWLVGPAFALLLCCCCRLVTLKSKRTERTPQANHRRDRLTTSYQS